MKAAIRNLRAKVAKWFLDKFGQAALTEHLATVDALLDSLRTENTNLKEENIAFRERFRDINNRARETVRGGLEVNHLKDEEGVVWFTTDDPTLSTREAMSQLRDVMKNLCPKIGGVILTRTATIKQMDRKEFESFKAALENVEFEQVQ